jgi:hypothetical protein
MLAAMDGRAQAYRDVFTAFPAAASAARCRDAVGHEVAALRRDYAMGLRDDVVAMN